MALIMNYTWVDHYQSEHSRDLNPTGIVCVCQNDGCVSMRKIPRFYLRHTSELRD
jgi:hypothetical protein